MKKRAIGALILSLLLSVTSSVQALAINNNGQALQNLSSSQSVIEEKAVNGEEFSKFVKEKAKILTNDPSYGETSVQYAITEGDNVVLSDNNGVDDSAGVLTKDTMYGIGSVSKVYTTAAVMQLVDEGKVDLDLPVVNYIPEFKTADEDKAYLKITPRMLINHSSGLMGSNYRNLLLNGDDDALTGEVLLKELAGERLKAEPGAFSVYCNDGFSLAEVLVERVSGKSFTEYIAENFSKKLNLENTKTPVDKFDRSRLAKTYNNGMETQEGCMMIGAGGIYSTAEENCKFIHSITSKKGDAILSERSINAMAEKEYLKGVWPTCAGCNSLGYGLGWDNVNVYPFNRYGITALSKGGDVGIYHASVVTIPEYDITMTALSSGGDSAIDQKFSTTVLLEYLKEKGIISTILPDEKIEETRSQYMPRELEKYSGEYIFQGTYVDVTINGDEDGKLTMKVKNGDGMLTAYHTYSGFFVGKVGDTDFAMRFIDEKNGKRYIEWKQYDNDENFAQSLTWLYIGQAVNKNTSVDLSKDSELEKIWADRASQGYFIINEKYSSIYYNNFYYFMRVLESDLSNGVMGTGNIKNDSKIENFVEIPGAVGRDLNDYTFTKENGVEYMNFAASVAMRFKDFGKLTNKDSNSSTVKIDDNGYAKWFKADKDMAGKKIKVSGPKNGTFAVYTFKDGYGYETINNSFVTHRDTAELGEDTVVVFAGDKGSEFKVDIIE